MARETCRSSTERCAKICLEVGIGGIEQLAPGDDDEVDACASGRQGRPPENLADQPFSSISANRIAQLSRSDDAKSDAGCIRRHQDQREISAVYPQPALEDPFEFGAAPDPAPFVEALGLHRILDQPTEFSRAVLRLG
jgi:hypothetical protein